MRMMSRHQQGTTLGYSLVMLFVLTLIATSAMETNIFSKKITYNFQDKEISFQAAESAAIRGENWLMSQTNLPNPVNSCNGSPCVLNLAVSINPEIESEAWWETNGILYDTTTLSGVRNQPRWISQFLRFVPDAQLIGHGKQTGIHYYRITARGTGLTGDAVSVVQTIVGVKF